MFSKTKEEKYLKEIEPLVNDRLRELGDLYIDENGKEQLKFGAVNVKWQIQKEIMKEKFDYEWKSPQDKNPNTLFD